MATNLVLEQIFMSVKTTADRWTFKCWKLFSEMRFNKLTYHTPFIYIIQLGSE